MAHPLPAEIEAQILSILESASPDTNLELEAIRAAHPEHADEIGRRLAPLYEAWDRPAEAARRRR